MFNLALKFGKETRRMTGRHKSKMGHNRIELLYFGVSLNMQTFSYYFRVQKRNMNTQVNVNQEKNVLTFKSSGLLTGTLG